MSGKPIRILLIEDDPLDAAALREVLYEAETAPLDITRVERLDEALEVLERPPFDIILLDLGLPDSAGLATLERTHNEAPATPIVIVSGHDDEALAVQAVKEGAQDYLVKGQITPALLLRSLRYAIERNRLQESLRSLALVDELTGLYNRRGLLRLGGQHLALARRARKGALILFADLDGLKNINDTWGHAVGDAALVEAAEVLRDTFRGSDVIARLGGDEFAVLALRVERGAAEVIGSRLERKLERANAEPERLFTLSLCAGVVYFPWQQPLLLEEMIARADAAMYERKRERRAPTHSPSA
ncbi:MAG: diguanylate cyclase [Acidobacteriota bacterium]